MKALLSASPTPFDTPSSDLGASLDKMSVNDSHKLHPKLDAKASGDECFRNGNFRGAVEHYSRALGAKDVSHPRAKLLSNRSASYAKLGEWLKALEDGKGALEESPKWHKAWLRGGCAMEGLGNLMDAYCVYCKALGGCQDGKTELMQAMVNLLQLIPIRWVLCKYIHMGGSHVEIPC